ncbi:MAG: toll/interleukin-1 receptor domain-containing protein [Pseudomonadota bacterium]
MMEVPNSFELPSKIERLLATLSKLYAQRGERNLQAIIVNSQTVIDEGYSYDNWNGGTHGHALHLVVPELIYLSNMEQIESLQQDIAQDLNRLHHVENEFIDKIFLEMNIEEDNNWRQESGLLLTTTRQVNQDDTKRLWLDDHFRLFLSHKTSVKRETATLKEGLRLFGVSAFVAHEDIHPTKEWQEEIENALSTMDGFAALLTSDFHDSDWTDQEVGYALARGVPIIAAGLDRNPYGFLAKFQALATDWVGAPEGIVKLLIKNDRMLSAYIRALAKCSNFNDGNTLSRILPAIESMNEAQVDAVVQAFNSNSELRGSFGFNGNRVREWGPGLIPHLHRWGSRRYMKDTRNPMNIVLDAGR